MAAQLIHDRVEMECLEGVWETLEGNARCRFRGTIRFTATSLVHAEEPALTLQRTVEWILPTPTPYRLVEPVQVIEVSSSEEDPEEDPEELPPEPVVDALDFPEGDEDALPNVDSPKDVMSAFEADSMEESGPRGIATRRGPCLAARGVIERLPFWKRAFESSLFLLGENTETLIEAELLEASFRAKSDSLQEVLTPALACSAFAFTFYSSSRAA
ncbi:hypothetical protein JHK82_019033 [Glycine max]|nr:hypothetical protein JHK85_019475 [Glycine max]KAG5143338.1 hypothetical protein JHK82_019033 [Glycine max]